MANEEEIPPTQPAVDLANDDRSIYQRMVSIIDELPAIGKNQRNTQQNFNFRGHDDVLNALTPLLGKHGVLIVPRVLERVTNERTTGQGKVMYEVNLHIEYTFYGTKGDSITGSAWGEGTDMGDKSTMKAGTMAFKAMLNQSFSINTEEGAQHDTDKGTVEETVNRAAVEKASDEDVEALVQEVIAAGFDELAFRQTVNQERQEWDGVRQTWLDESRTNFEKARDSAAAKS